MAEEKQGGSEVLKAAESQETASEKGGEWLRGFVEKNRVNLVLGVAALEVFSAALLPQNSLAAESSSRLPDNRSMVASSAIQNDERTTEDSIRQKQLITMMFSSAGGALLLASAKIRSRS